MTAATSHQIDIHDISLDASALFFIIDRLEDSVSRGDDAAEEATAMARVAHQLATKLDADLRALSLRTV